MSCVNPMVAVLPRKGSLDKRPIFRNSVAKAWKNSNIVLPEGHVLLPCRQCIHCRLEYSRQWAIRCMHESSLYVDNSFITLTYNNANLPSNGSLNKRDMQLFWKKLRYFNSSRKVRYYYAGEYGEKFRRPHYHSIVFNLDFDDKKYWKTVGGHKYYTSESLQSIWGKGFVTIGEVTFDSAAYVARYCTKKITGDMADDHYMSFDKNTGEVYQLQPEFSQASTGRGIGYEWLSKWKADVYPMDECVVNGRVCKPPKFYDRILEKEDPDMYVRIKEKRLLDREKIKDDGLFARLVARRKHTEQRMKRLVRVMEMAEA